MGSNPGRSYKLIFLPSLWIMLKWFGTTRAPTRSGSCEAVSLGSFSDRQDQKLREMKWAIFLFHSYGYRLERRSMIRGCAGGHRKSRRTAGVIHRRNICGRLQTITFGWGRFQATNIGEVVLIGTRGAQLIIASGAIRRQGFPDWPAILWDHSAASRTWRAVRVRMVTSSSVAVGCNAIVASKSALVAFILTAMPSSWIISAAPSPTM